MESFYRFPFNPFTKNGRVDLSESIRSHIAFLIYRSWDEKNLALSDFHFDLVYGEHENDWEKKIKAGISKFEKRLKEPSVICKKHKTSLQYKISIEGKILENNEFVNFKAIFNVTNKKI